MPRLSRGKVERIERVQTAAEICAYCPRQLILEHERYRGWHDACSPRRRPLDQYVMIRKWPDGHQWPLYVVERSATGSKPSHWLIERPVFVGHGDTIGAAREHIPPGYKRLDRRKDDPADVVEVWV